MFDAFKCLWVFVENEWGDFSTYFLFFLRVALLMLAVDCLVSSGDGCLAALVKRSFLASIRVRKVSGWDPVGSASDDSSSGVLVVGIEWGLGTPKVRAMEASSDIIMAVSSLIRSS